MNLTSCSLDKKKLQIERKHGIKAASNYITKRGNSAKYFFYFHSPNLQVQLKLNGTAQIVYFSANNYSL